MNPCLFSPSCCHIDLTALARNFKSMGNPASLMPVIKSDAYGHGLLECARTLAEHGAKQFAVGTVPEGLYLREQGFGQDIVPLLGALGKEEWQAAFAQNLLVPVLDRESLHCAAHCADGVSRPIAIALNTGMGRLGFVEEDLPDLLAYLKSSQLLPDLAISHFACADMPEQEAYTAGQVRLFRAMTDHLKQVYPGLRRSLSNSAGLQTGVADFELARPGITLYGGNPFAGTSQEHLGAHFSWVMSVSAKVLQVHRLKRGESVSYGRLFTADREMTIAVLSMGYATGYSRKLTNKASVVINGQRCPQIGRVCMGMIMVDVSAIKRPASGETAWVLGGSGCPNPVTAQELADLQGTICYEVLCRFGAMNQRIFHH